MTKFKLKEKLRISATIDEQVDMSSLESGTMLYSYNYDTMLLIVDDVQFGRVIIDLSDSTTVGDIEGDTFEETLAQYEKDFGPFYTVGRAKLTFKV